MKAIGFKTSYPIDHADSLIEFEKDQPLLAEHDILVQVQAVSVNPVDYKVRHNSAPNTVLPEPKIAGYDAVGIVEAVGAQVKNFAVGDRVYYAGDINRDGSNAEYQVVDSRITALAPTSLNDAEAAALPLTTLTAWEAIFDRLGVAQGEADKTILVIGGAGGVGSIAIQLLKQLTNLTIIGTASRPESEAWAKQMGANYVANHYDLVNSVRALGFETVDYICNTASVNQHWAAMGELIVPQGMICGIVGTEGPVDLGVLQGKSVGYVWELMFTRPMFKTADMSRQHEILHEVAQLIDAGKLQTTLTETIEGFTVESLKEAHRRIETGRTIGKIAVTYN